MSGRTYSQSAVALGTTIELRVAAPDEASAEKWLGGLWEEIDRFDRSFSRFRPGSELNEFNRRAGEKVRISEEFRKILEVSRHFSGVTGGLFNPFVLPILQRAGYMRSMVTGSASPDHSGKVLADPGSLRIGDDWASIPPDAAIDLGGIGKGYLADRLGEMLEPMTSGYCLSLGGDMRVNGEDAGSPWVIDLQSAADRSRNIGHFSGSGSFGIATSGAFREVPGKTQAHLVDPRTGDILEASRGICTIVAENAAAADVFASCVLIEGRDLAEKLMKGKMIRAALLQDGASAPFALGEGFAVQTET